MCLLPLSACRCLPVHVYLSQPACLPFRLFAITIVASVSGWQSVLCRAAPQLTSTRPTAPPHTHTHQVGRHQGGGASPLAQRDRVFTAVDAVCRGAGDGGPRQRHPGGAGHQRHLHRPWVFADSHRVLEAVRDRLLWHSTLWCGLNAPARSRLACLGMVTRARPCGNGAVCCVVAGACLVVFLAAWWRWQRRRCMCVRACAHARACVW